MIQKIKDVLSSEAATHYSIAFLLNSIALLILSLIIGQTLESPQRVMITSSSIEETIDFTVPVNIPETFTFDDKHSSLTEEIIIEQESDSSLLIDQIETPSNLTIETIEKIGPEFSSDLIGQTLSGVSSNLGAGFSNQASNGGALDRLTIEIINNAQYKDTNVIWLLDASISLSLQRQLIADRFEKIIQELDFAETPFDINHEVYAFGQTLQRMTDSLTNDPFVLKKSVENISIDLSGVENTFGAVGNLCKTYGKYGSSLLIVIFTDEVGDDSNLLDAVSNLARLKNASIYVVGSPAPFGKSFAEFKFVDIDPSYDQSERWVRIEQGPETLHNMILDIKSLSIDNETLDSGFGPYALSRLCLETGGIYFSVHPNRNNMVNTKKNTNPLTSYISRFFDSEVMKKYKPDYRSSLIQNKEAETHVVKKSLVMATKIPLVINGEQTLKFKAYNEGVFVNELSMAQRFSAKIEPKINEIYNILVAGESAYQSLEDRWKVSYCLAMGRILATKCRIENYNLVLAEAKRGLKKKDPKSNVWILESCEQLNVANSSIKKYYDGALKYLKFVSQNYPDTPWGLIANEELKIPMGYRWVEIYEEPPKSNMGNGNPNRKDDMSGPKLVPKPIRKIEKI
jgi:hypothetical protein